VSQNVPQNVIDAMDTVVISRQKKSTEKAAEKPQLARNWDLEIQLEGAMQVLNKREAQLQAAVAERTALLSQNVEEKKFLEEQIAQVGARYSKLMSEYQALYDYCERFLKDADGRRIALEGETAKLKGELSQGDNSRQMLEEEIRRGQARAASLESENSDLRTREQLFAKTLNASMARLNRLHEMLRRTRGTLMELEGSLRKFIENTAAKDNGGGNGLALRAAKIFLEQLRMELEGMQGLDVVLDEATRDIARTGVTKELKKV
jgi:chromosome segregation ATPase